MFQGDPHALPGMKVGLLGGSFDPPHRGHVLITAQALRRFRLDRVWWLVTPGNPLKSHGPAAIERRIEACRTLVQDRRVSITGIEARLNTRYTADTLERLALLYPGVRFVWLMGADNLVSFHHWEQWDAIMHRLPIGVLARPGAQIRAGLSIAATRFASARLPESMAVGLADGPAPRWCLATGPMSPLSSSAIRATGAWTKREVK